MDEPGARRRPHADPGAAGARRRARHLCVVVPRHRRLPAGSSPASATWPRSGTVADLSADGASGASAGRSSALRPTSSSWRCTATAASTRPAAAPGGGATSSPAPRSARCSARCWPGPRRMVGRARPARPVRRDRGRRRAGHAGQGDPRRRAGVRAGAALRAGRAVGRLRGAGRVAAPVEPPANVFGPRCTAATRRRAGRRRHRPGRGRARRPAARAGHRRRARQRAARQPAVPPAGARRDGWLEVLVGGRWRPARRGALPAAPPGRRRGAGAWRPMPPGPASRCSTRPPTGCARPRRSSCDGPAGRRSTTPTPRRRWRATVDRVAAHLPRPRTRRPSAAGARDPGHHVRGRRRPAGPVPAPDADRSQAEFLRAHGIDELVAAARAPGTSGPTSATSRR